MITNIPIIPMITKLVVAIVICVDVSDFSNMVVITVVIINPIVIKVVSFLWFLMISKQFIIKSCTGVMQSFVISIRVVSLSWVFLCMRILFQLW